MVTELEFIEKIFRELYKKRSESARSQKRFAFKITSTGCVECTSHRYASHGYLQVRIDKKSTLMNRFVYCKYNKCSEKFIYGLVIRHKCDNKFCINPMHLEKGTHKENSEDMVKRQRHKVGEAHHCAKLTSVEVVEIRNNNTLSQEKLGRKYGITQSVVSRIKNNIKWKHVAAGVA